jgi:hypothetical protein
MSDEKKKVSCEWILPEGAVTEAIRAVETEGGTIGGQLKPYECSQSETEGKGFTPLLKVPVTVSRDFLIGRITDVWLKRKRPGGQVIDTREGKLEVRSDPGLERGKLVFIDDKGKRVFERGERREGVVYLRNVLGRL